MAVEFRGFDNLVYAEVITDNNLTGTANGYVTGPVKELAPAGEISKTIEQAQATKYYDNLAAIVIQGRGADTVALTVAVIPLAVLAELTGQFYDPETGAISEGAATAPKYFAIG
jgi:hypothetical protein